MRRPALQHNQVDQMLGVAEPERLPAPVSGWNTSDPLASMNSLYATQLTNFYPNLGEVVLRRGMAAHADGMTGTVKSLHYYAPKTGTSKLFATTDAGFYDVTAGGTVSGVAKALTDGWVNSTNVANSAGDQFLWACNGVDKAVLYNGSTWTSLDAGSTPAITGLDTTTVIWPWIFKRRLFLIQKNSMSVWHFGVDEIAGAAGEFKVGPLFKKGGYLVSGTNWSIDAGEGLDDLWVIITSEGEVAVYKGTNVTDAAAWSLIGVYYVGVPLGRNCFVRFGGDIIVLTEQGAFELSRVLVSGSVNFDTALSRKIQPSMATVAALFKANRGWQMTIYPPTSALIINVPTQEGQLAIQYVMNTITRAWCNFSGWNVTCFIYAGGVLYAGTQSGFVRKVWTGGTDIAANIVGYAQTAHVTIGGRKPNVSSIPLIRPVIAYDGGFVLGLGLSSNLEDPTVTSVINIPAPTGDKNLLQWYSPRCQPGFSYSALLQVTTGTANISWLGQDYMLTPGGAFG